MTQYRITAPGGYEQFYSDRDAAEEAHAVTSRATLQYADASTGGKWRTLKGEAVQLRDKGTDSYLSNVLKF